MQSAPPPPTRCLRCGGLVSVPVRSGGGAVLLPCPHCGAPLAVLPSRELPPLYSWEVYSGLYASAPIPRGNPYRWPRGIASLLWASTILMAGAAGTLGAIGVLSVTSGPLTVGGVVHTPGSGGSLMPLPGAVVHLSGESGKVLTAVTDAAGAFRFTGVPVGGIEINASYGGLAPATLELFAAPYYTSAGNLAHLGIVLSGGNGTASTVVVSPSFTDLESYVTSVGSGAVLLGLGALGAGIGAWAAERPRPGSGVAAAGAGAAAAPVTFYLLGLIPAFPQVLLAAVIAGVLGGAGGTLAAGYRWLTGPFEGDGPVEPVP